MIEEHDRDLMMLAKLCMFARCVKIENKRIIWFFLFRFKRSPLTVFIKTKIRPMTDVKWVFI